MPMVYHSLFPCRWNLDVSISQDQFQSTLSRLTEVVNEIGCWGHQTGPFFYTAQYCCATVHNKEETVMKVTLDVQQPVLSSK